MYVTLCYARQERAARCSITDFGAQKEKERGWDIKNINWHIYLM